MAPVSTVNWTGSLVKGQTSQVAFDPITGIAPGNHVLTVYTSDPNGLPDQLPSNDTIRQAFLYNILPFLLQFPKDLNQLLSRRQTG